MSADSASSSRFEQLRGLAQLLVVEAGGLLVELGRGAHLGPSTGPGPCRCWRRAASRSGCSADRTLWSSALRHVFKVRGFGTGLRVDRHPSADTGRHADPRRAARRPLHSPDRARYRSARFPRTGGFEAATVRASRAMTRSEHNAGGNLPRAASMDAGQRSCRWIHRRSPRQSTGAHEFLASARWVLEAFGITAVCLRRPGPRWSASSPSGDVSSGASPAATSPGRASLPVWLVLAAPAAVGDLRSASASCSATTANDLFSSLQIAFQGSGIRRRLAQRAGVDGFWMSMRDLRRAGDRCHRAGSCSTCTSPSAS